MYGTWFTAVLVGILLVLLVIGTAIAASPLIAIVISGAVVMAIAVVWSMLRGGRETRPHTGGEASADPAAPVGPEGTAAARVERQRSGEPVPSEGWGER
jgi:hypothetical protein